MKFSSGSLEQLSFIRVITESHPAHVAGKITLCQNPAGGVVVRYRGILSGERYIFLHLASKLPGSRQVCLLRTGLAEAAHPQGSNVAADRLQKAATPGVGKRDR